MPSRYEVIEPVVRYRKAGLTVETVLEAIRRQLEGDIRRLFDEDGDPTPFIA